MTLSQEEKAATESTLKLLYELDKVGMELAERAADTIRAQNLIISLLKVKLTRAGEEKARLGQLLDTERNL